MRRTPSLCRNPDGRAYATIPASGRKRIYFGEYGSEAAEKAYRKWLGQLLLTPETEPAPPGPSARIVDFAGQYLAYAKSYYARDGKPTAEFRNVRDAMRVLLRYAADDLAGSFGPKSFRAVRDAMHRDGYTTKKGHHRKFNGRTVNAYMGRIRRFFRWCESRELVKAGTTHALETVEPIRAGKASVPAVPWDIVKATLPFCRDDLAAMIQVTYWCGLRPGEACRLCVRDLDMSEAIWWYTPTEHKTSHHGRELVKAIPIQAQKILRPFIARAASDDEPLFKTRFGNPYSADSFGTAIKAAITKARKADVDLPLWSPNRLRHAIAEKIDAMSGREDAQHYLGHSRPDTTAVYAGRNHRILRRVAEDLGRDGEAA